MTKTTSVVTSPVREPCGLIGGMNCYLQGGLRRCLSRGEHPLASSYQWAGKMYLAFNGTVKKELGLLAACATPLTTVISLKSPATPAGTPAHAQKLLRHRRPRPHLSGLLRALPGPDRAQ